MTVRYWTGLLALSGSVLADTILSKNTAIANCPPLGPVLPPPKNPSSDATVQATLSQLEALQDEVAGLVGNATALSLSVASAYEDKILANLAYTPLLYNSTGTHNVDGDTVFRIASVSKTFTVLGLLLLGDEIHFSDSITKYVPELNRLKGEQTVQNPVTTVNWDRITIGALASQLSGVGDSLGNDLANDPVVNLTQYGLPALTPEDHDDCGYLPSSRPCTWNDFFKNFGKRAPSYGPYTTPAYSDVTYDILGIVIERVSGESYGDFVQNRIFTPLNMTRSFVTKPENDSIGFISSEANFWSTSMGFEQTDGGMYSSANDLAKFGQAILSYKLIDEPTTRAWLKPHTHTSSLGISVGAPWEIGRTNNITVDGRVIDIYTKIGDVPDYNALFLVVPDYGMTLSMLSAGPESSVSTQMALATTVLKAITRGFEAAGKSEANVTYAGTYINAETNSSISLGIDDQSGLLVQSWIMNGQDILETYPMITGASSASGETGGLSSSTYLSIRLYPTGLQSNDSDAWRAVYNTVEPAEIPAEDELFFFLQFACHSWELIDNLVYGYNSLDAFIFGFNNSSNIASSITPRAFRQTLTRV
ncbi:hypothetical protein PISL3812_00118 [Talaromyces islandicus]|uniref:Uncharacterized protein n=1 Tax=Talaromyces islandicus TaxID=28573 RepID=A0A0U1LJ05_TALIS|nr:hypothetical protein PISL3812_00118 [Talaromyces islandicus]